MQKIRFVKGLRNFFIKFLVFLIRFYQICISPLFPSCCRYTPSCSAYAREAIERHGPVKGLYFAMRRVLRCNPFCRGGHDPVPDFYESGRQGLFLRKKIYGKKHSYSNSSI